MSAMISPAALTAAGVRREFPILDRIGDDGRPLIYLDTGATAQKPQAVIDKITECYEQFNANVHRGVHPLHERVTAELEASRKKVAAFLNTRPLDELDLLDDVSEIIFTAGTTMGINLVAHAWGRQFLQPGDEILLNHLEHHANIVPWQMIAAERGAKVVWCPLTPDGLIDLTKFDQLLTPRTKMVAVTAMSNVLGTIPPVAEIVRRAHAVGAKVLVDAAQFAPHGPIDVQAWDADFVVFSGHKLYGPTGVGVLYGKLELLEAMGPFLGGGNMIDEVFDDYSTYKRPPFKFEAGTLPIAEAIALGTAIDRVQAWGWDVIHHQEQLLLEACHARLENIPGVKIYGPGVDQKGSIVSFTVEGIPAHDLGTSLGRHGIAVRASHHCAKPLHRCYGIDATTRASFAVYNTLEEVEALGEALEATRQVFFRRRG
ncbi:MAG TPA: SufS family cysteine desulfurase [Planctomycetaceae bacterium]|nr:SufS family cysteine desulfurase [Planctomycetaceae bacterium]